MHLLVVEDDVSLASTLTQGLRGEGFDVATVHDGAAALSHLGEHDVDVVILDRDLPGLHGDTVCRTLVSCHHPARILMLTAASSEQDLVHGLGQGADDYVAKPFSYPELVARIRALGRRGHEVRDDLLQRTGIELDVTRRTVARDGRTVYATPKEFEVLRALLEADGAPLGTADLLDQVWRDTPGTSPGVVKVVVHSLRRKLGEPPAIETEPGFGYRVR